MGKRQKRYTGASIHSSELINKEVNIILKTGEVFHVKVLSFQNEEVFAEDPRLKRHRFPVKDIFEIVLDFTSPY